MVRHSHLSAAAVAMLVLAAASAAGARPDPRLTADPERKVMEKAGWTYIGVSDGVLVYMKDAIPGSAEGARRVVTAYEALTPRDREGFAFRSVESLGEFDCDQGRTRILRETFYKEPSLKGETWSKPDSVATDWTNAVEGSIGFLRVAFACRERPIA
jgi:hypothetical protein